MRTERGVPVARPFAWARGFGHQSLATSDQEALDAVQKPGPRGGFCPVFYYPLGQMPPRGLPTYSTREVLRPRGRFGASAGHTSGAVTGMLGAASTTIGAPGRTRSKRSMTS